MSKTYQEILSEELKKLHMKGKTKSERQKLFAQGVKAAKKRYNKT